MFFSLLLSVMMVFGPEAGFGIRTTPFPGIDENGIQAGCITIRQGITLRGDTDGFGGLSAMHLERNSAIFLSDTGMVFTGPIERNEQSFVTKVPSARQWMLATAEGQVMGRPWTDAEGLSVDGTELLISFEGENRLQRYRRDEVQFQQEEVLRNFEDERLGKNSGMEALTRLQDGRLMVISEGTDRNGLALVMIATPTEEGWSWTEATYRPQKDFGVTEAAVDLQTHDLFVLERAYSKLKGPRARLVRVPVSAINDPVLAGTELTALNFLHGVDNMEGLVMERREDGSLIGHMISDDNYSDRQRTVIIGFEVDETTENCRP